MLSNIIQAFESRNPGVASFETFAGDCMAEMANDPANAGLYLLLGVTAKQFYDQFADQPLTVSVANERKDALLALAQDAAAALEKPAEERLQVLNRIAQAGFGGGQ